MRNSDNLFPDFVGNENALRQLSVDIAAGRFPHALLLEGPSGCGKRTLAGMLAAAAVCADQERAPCGQCEHCRKAREGIHPDVEEITGDGGERSFHIDRIRELKEKAYILPNEARVRVLILSSAHTMTPQAQNALLKILEEPPAHLVFILTCESRAQMLPTIRSRVRTVSLSGVEWEQAYPLLKKRLPDADDEMLSRAFSISGGVIGKVLSDMSDNTLQKVLEVTPRVAKAITAGAEWELMAALAPLEKDKAAITGTLGALQLIFRDAVTLHYGGQTTLSIAPDIASDLSRSLSGKRLTALLKETEGLRADVSRNMNQTLLLTRMCARLRVATER